MPFLRQGRPPGIAHPTPSTGAPLYLIDAIGPFFRGVEGRRINWSKIPFEHLPFGEGREARFRQISDDLDTFCRRVAALGYNAITLDDFAHLCAVDYAEPEVCEVVSICREAYRGWFAIAAEHGLQVYVTMDVLSFTPSLRGRIGTTAAAATAFLAEKIPEFFRDFPGVAGLVLRIGESDGQDVHHHFSSELVLRTAAGVNRFLRELVPVFERCGKTLIFRTWTVGAHQVGDFIWHRDTFQRALEAVGSEHFILSMKFGESDFFRYLPLNSNFFRTRHKKLIELQTRREYEGCGEFPSFIGADYERFARELETAPNVVGISVWCQTGGWLPFRRLAFFGEGSVWTEINTAVTLRLFRDRVPVEEAVRACLPGGRWVEALELLRLSEEVVKELLYIEEFARQKLFFRRVRIPPLLGTYWHNIFINHSARKVVRHFVRDPGTSLRQAEAALRKIDKMRQLAATCGLPEEDIEFMRDTFGLFALARTYYLMPFDEQIVERVKAARLAYKSKYPRGTRPRYRVKLDFRPFRLSRRTMGIAFALFARKKRGYRILDRLFTLHLLGFVYRFVRRSRPGAVPSFARESAMGIDAVFK